MNFQLHKIVNKDLVVGLDVIVSKFKIILGILYEHLSHCRVSGAMAIFLGVICCTRAYFVKQNQLCSCAELSLPTRKFYCVISVSTKFRETQHSEHSQKAPSSAFFCLKAPTNTFTRTMNHVRYIYIKIVKHYRRHLAGPGEVPVVVLRSPDGLSQHDETRGGRSSGWRGLQCGLSAPGHHYHVTITAREQYHSRRGRQVQSGGVSL